MAETDFIQSALGDAGDIWRKSTLAALAALQTPDGVLGRRRTLLRSDIHEQWARWFVEGLADPQRYVGRGVTYPYLYNDVFQVVDRRFHEFTTSEKHQLASASARILNRMVGALDSERRRKPVSKADRSLMIDLAGDLLGCWICGARFSGNAVDSFVFGELRPTQLPPFVDVLKPRGLNARDLRIEIDHVVPFARGGDDEGSNLRLACGWCNRHKRDLTSLYDAEGRPPTAQDNELELTTLPHPFWTVRLLAVERRCEHPAGCEKSVDTAEITVVLTSAKGASNPSNLRATCYDHDPMMDKRLQPPKIVKKIWKMS